VFRFDGLADCVGLIVTEMEYVVQADLVGEDDMDPVGEYVFVPYIVKDGEVVDDPDLLIKIDDVIVTVCFRMVDDGQIVLDNVVELVEVLLGKIVLVKEGLVNGDLDIDEVELTVFETEFVVLSELVDVPVLVELRVSDRLEDVVLVLELVYVSVDVFDGSIDPVERIERDSVAEVVDVLEGALDGV